MDIKQKNLGFSLIELSIVLIIIGLLVAGVTGGASLINSAKIQSTITDMNNLKTSFIIFYSLKDRPPGDLNEDKCIGYCYKGNSLSSTENTYTTFGGKYEGVSVNFYAGPFVELYLEGLLDFEPEISTVNTSDDAKLQGERTPLVKGLDNAMYNDFHTFYYYSASPKNSSSHSFYKIKNGYYQRIMKYGDNYLDPKTILKLEQKIDDQKPNSGMLRSGCSSPTGAGVPYETLIDNKATCTNLWYFIIGI